VGYIKYLILIDIYFSDGVSEGPKSGANIFRRFVLEALPTKLSTDSVDNCKSTYETDS